MPRLEFTDEEFRNARCHAEEQYRNLGHIHCPFFQGTVTFNSEGFGHIRFKTWNRGRDRRDQFMRLKYLHRAPEILRLSRTVQGIQQTHAWERRHKRGVWESHLVAVTYFEFVAVLEGRRFKVIVKQLLGGNPFFWSLIPYWRQSEQGTRLLHTGDLSEE